MDKKIDFLEILITDIIQNGFRMYYFATVLLNSSLHLAFSNHGKKVVSKIFESP